MPQHNEILIKRELEKSDEALVVAQESLEKNRLTTALNRIYYAIFYTVTALAYKNNFATAKHSKLIGWFNQKFVHENEIFNPEIYKIYRKAFDLRQESDYETLYMPSADETKQLLSDAKIFIEAVRRLI